MTLSELGFKRKRYEDYLTELEQQARELFGVDVNLSDRSPMGQWIKLLAYQRAEENELAEAVYNSAFVDNATGITLDYAVKYKSLTRFPALTAIGKIEIQVLEGSTVESGLLVGTKDNIQFLTINTVSDSDNTGLVVVDIEAVEPGAVGNVPANTITEILTPRAEVVSVNNQEETSRGRDRETDAELRNRYHATSGESSTPDGITTILLNNVQGIEDAIVIENNGDTADSDGRPAHSFEAIVLGGDAMEIGQAILKGKAAGIRSYGSNTVVVKDASNNDQTISFSYAAVKNIYVNANIVVNSSFPADGSDIIVSKIMEYISSLKMGNDVILGKITALVFNLAGVDDVTVTLSTDGITYAQNNITIDKVEVAKTSIDKLVINIE
jgi:uncharacterized phage protein gp47/JayE